ncbi:WD40 repeat domain-containing serine/threonine protein kinase [Pseudofrankia inefficax]|uniref:Serine/threonine protein kinase with WD40 repeats n=1 Tax=Pseudofrankia inefficax (strain DSM 45817 / CECT 9037 / DDB 130130 / EuI1c) TaxID=298654 RepID=E3J106_PSEI1|nr:serine/threonine-protein kinase [Pseudofrankia inefficax]ADP84070.1 serine/threonine protein kinase with WD40 repeats [Pseudofrankia inefficax]
MRRNQRQALAVPAARPQPSASTGAATGGNTVADQAAAENTAASAVADVAATTTASAVADVPATTAKAGVAEAEPPLAPPPLAPPALAPPAEPGAPLPAAPSEAAAHLSTAQTLLGLAAPRRAPVVAQQAPTLPQQLTLPTHPTYPLGAVAAEPLAPDDPEQLGDYQLVGRLGEGGMGTVYLGVAGADTAIGPHGLDGELRLVAIKMIRADLARLPEFRARFLREADVARRVSRFCTAEVLEVVDPPNGPPYLVTEYIDGLTLTRAVLAGGPLRTGDLERLAVSVAAALTAIHGAGLVHRDLKPSNVILSALGPRVIDFGIAQATDAHGVLSHDIQRIGTPAFMAPEQANGQPVTAAADIFAWGGLMTYAGTGVLPFGDGPTPVQLYRVVHTEPNLDGLGPALRPIVTHAMRKDPADRPTAQELFLQLVGMGPQTHLDPAVSHAIRSGALPGPPTALVDTDPQPRLDLGHAADAAANASPAAATATTGTTGTAPGTTNGQAAHLAATLRALIRPRVDEQAASPDPAPDASAIRTWRDGLRHVSLLVTPLLALLLIGILIPVVLLHGPTKSPTPASVATDVAASADQVRPTDAALADALSLAAFRISPALAARAGLRTSFAAAAATPLTGHTGAVLGAAVSPDGRVAATASADGSIRLWDVRDAESSRPLAVIDQQDGWVTAAAFSPDGNLLATAGYNRLATLWDVSDPTRPSKVASLRGHDGYVASVAFSPDGNLLATAGYDDTARVWNVVDPTDPVQLAVLTGHTGWVRQVAFSPDGRLLATASTDHTTRLWDVAVPTSPTLLATLTGHTDYVWALAFSPDGRELATAGYDGTARLWDVTDPAHPRAVATIPADAHWVLAVAFSPDGRTLATGGRDGTVHLWDLTAPGQPAAAGVLAGHSDWIESIAFTPDGRALLTGSADRTARLTPLSDDALTAAACRDRSSQLDSSQWQHYVPEVPYRPTC